MKRYLFSQAIADLKKKMVFIGGPRQIGKTTLAQSILGRKAGYLNWDDPAHREKILKYQLPRNDLWVFDELHKYGNWRNYLKGMYDTKDKTQQILVTGSAKLDYYRYSGDSLQGRYHYLRMHPLSVKELGIQTNKDLLGLLKYGGFPEPYFEQSESSSRRWSREYRTHLLREELVELERVSDLGQMELLMLRLPDLVGAPLSINALKKDLQLNHKTVSRWINILERIWAVFRISPFGSAKIRAVKKEQKHYHYDWTLVEEPGLKFENMVAVHLLKWVHFLQDTEGRDYELRYFRDAYKREVDFVICEKDKPLLAIECKVSSKAVSESLRYFKEKYPKARAIQISLGEDHDYKTPEGIEVTPALSFLKTLI